MTVCRDDIIKGLQKDLTAGKSEGKTETEALQASKYYKEAHSLEILAAICESEKEMNK